MDQAVEGNFMTENQETVPGSSSEGVTEVVVSNEIVVNLVPDIQSKYMKNKTGNAKSKIQTVKTKEMTVASAPERKILKRKAAHPPISDMVMDSIKSLKKRNGASFEDIRKNMEEKYVVDMKRLKYHVDKFLQKNVGEGKLTEVEGRFKIKKSEDIKKGSKNVPRKEGQKELKKKPKRSRARKRSGSATRAPKRSRTKRRSSKGKKKERRKKGKEIKKKKKKKKKSSDDELEMSEDDYEDESEESDSDESIAFGGAPCPNPSRGVLGEYDQIDPCARMPDLELPILPGFPYPVVP